MSPTLIVLVHGTWGRGIFPTVTSFFRAGFWRKAQPRWFDENSSFRRGLSTMTATTGPEVISFEWSGSNSVHARLEAAQSLRKLLLSRGRDRRIIIIAHSHGGNVVLRALSEGYSHADTTVITLATPFLKIFATSAGPKFGSYFLTTLLGCSLLAFAFYHALGFFFDVEEYGNLFAWIFLITIGPLSWWFVDFFINPAPQRPDKPINRTWLLRPFELAEAANYSIAPTFKLYVLRGVNDEASLTLAAGRIGAKLSNVAWSAIVTVAAAVYASPVFMYLGSKWLTGDPERETIFFVWALFGSGLSFLLLYAPNLFNTVYGREFLVGASRAEVGADSVPDAPHAIVKTLGPRIEVSRLRHCLYDHPDCIAAIADFCWPHALLPDGAKATAPSKPRSLIGSLSIALFVIALGVVLFRATSGPSIRVTEPDRIKLINHNKETNLQVIGYDAPQSTADCAGEQAQAERATLRVRQLISEGKFDVEQIQCPCQRSKANRDCTYRGKCARLKIDGEDIATILVREGYARPYTCQSGRCPERRPWC